MDRRSLATLGRRALAGSATIDQITAWCADYGMATPTSLRRYDPVLNDAVDRLEAALDDYAHGALLLADLWCVVAAVVRELERPE